MKKRVSKDIVILFIIIPLFLFGAFYISSRMENQLPPFSVINKSGSGLSVFYESFKELNIPVERTLKSVNDFDSNTVQIVTPGGDFDVNSDEIKIWVKNGGILVYLVPINIHFVDYGVTPETKGTKIIYNYEKGKIIVFNNAFLNNKALTKGTDSAYEIFEELCRYSSRKIYFNEANLFTSVSKKTLWEYIPIEVKFILYQLLIVIIALFYYKGKRFGKAVPLHEEVERSENEYLYSAASLYRQVNAFDLIIETYYKSFLKKARRDHETILKFWENENLPSISKLQRVYEFIDKRERKVKSKEYLKIVIIIEQLKSILDKRRESYWKTLKNS